MQDSIVTGSTLKAMADGLLPKGYMPIFYDVSRPEGEERAVR